MNRVFKLLIAIEVLLVFLPVTAFLLVGYFWVFLLVWKMLSTLAISQALLILLPLVIFATFGLIGVFKLTLMTIYDEVEPLGNIKAIVYIALGCLVCLTLIIFLMNIEPRGRLYWYLVLPIFVSLQLILMNRKKLRNEI